MDAIKKKMQAMKLEKEGALDKADQLDQTLNDQKEKNEKVSDFHQMFTSHKKRAEIIHFLMFFYCEREQFPNIIIK